MTALIDRVPSGGTSQRREVRLLLTSAGRRVELLGCFRSAAADLGLDLTVFACDRLPDWSSACRAADGAFTVPPVSDPDYVPALLDLCRRHGITIVVPTIDPELLSLGEARAAFRTLGVEVIVSDPDVLRIAFDKQATSDLLRRHGIDAPRSASPPEVLDAVDDWSWPLLAKPRHGSAGRAVQIVSNPAELNQISFNEPFVVQELLGGAEYTVNVFIDRDGCLRCAVPHRRVQTRAGEVEKGITQRLPELGEAAAKIVACLPGARGPLCFQAFVDGARCSVFEINARFGGGYPLAHRSGAQFTRWLLEQVVDAPSSAGDQWREGVMMLRYDAAMFVGP
jgi:carbamoyl-phosphate synthase large subunit